MWVFTKYGFFSVVCARKGPAVDPELLMVRARVRAQLSALNKRFPDDLGGCEIRENAGTDYRFRIIVEKSVWVRVMCDLAEELDYANFKDEVARFQGRAGQRYEAALHEAWAVMYELEVESDYRGARGRIR